MIAHPLVDLTRKGTLFTWQDEHESAMQALKDAITTSPALISIDYTSDLAIYLSIDSSWCSVGWILAQDCTDGRRCPTRFGSIAWNERETWYSQAKLELYGLFRALRALCLFIVGIKNLVVKMDTQYIRGMLKNPDIQPNATINWWIPAILLFNFKLVHMPASRHHGPDGLSQREPADGESKDDDPEEWIDDALSLGLWVVSWTQAHHADREPAVWTLSVGIPSTTVATIDKDNDNDLTIPTSDKVRQAEDQVEDVRHYLTTLRLPDHLDDAARNHLLKRAKRFFIADDRLWRRQEQGRHQLFILPPQRLSLIRDAHDNLGHKGFYSTRRTIFDHFWWPSLKQDVKWYITTCHQCQLRHTTKICIPPTVAVPAPLLRKLYVDTTLMPPTGGFRYITQARCSLTAWPEWRTLHTETGCTLGMFLFEEVLCRWGAVEEIVTDNGTPYVAMLDWLADRYSI